jgi:hypothetical protein
LDWSKAVADCLTDDADANKFLAQAGARKSASFGLAGIVNGIFKVHEEFLNGRGPVGVKKQQAPSKRTARPGATQWEFAAAFPSDTALDLSLLLSSDRRTRLAPQWKQVGHHRVADKAQDLAKIMRTGDPVKQTATWHNVCKHTWGAKARQ